MVRFSDPNDALFLSSFHLHPDIRALFLRGRNGAVLHSDIIPK